MQRGLTAWFTLGYSDNDGPEPPRERLSMISIRKYLGKFLPEAAESCSSGSNSEATVSALNESFTEYRSLLLTVGECTERAAPFLGPEMMEQISTHASRVSVLPRCEGSLATLNLEICRDLQQWADRAAELQKQQDRELKEIIGVVAKTAETIGKRDEKYSSEIGAMALHLRAVADQSDMGAIRRSIIESAAAFQSCIARMAEDGREVVKRVTAQAEEYRARLEETERLSVLDPLTGLTNRRGLERNVTYRMEAKHTFSVILIDLDRFKEINDKFGHVAGDDLLRQFAIELKAQFPPSDLVTRMGGDEFVAVVAGGIVQAQNRAEMIRTWVVGHYSVPVSGTKQDLQLQASLGLAAWDMQESLDMLLARADVDMYRAKALSKDRTSWQQTALKAG